MPKPVAHVLTVSDGVSSGSREDVSGARARDKLIELGFSIGASAVTPDDKSAIQAVVKTWVREGVCRLLVTTGGTGIASRDVTPESIQPLLDKEIPGYGELLRLDGKRHTPMAVLSRSLAGVAGETLILVLPGNPSAVEQGIDAITPTLRHALQLLTGDTKH